MVNDIRTALVVYATDRNFMVVSRAWAKVLEGSRAEHKLGLGGIRTGGGRARIRLACTVWQL